MRDRTLHGRMRASQCVSMRAPLPRRMLAASLATLLAAMLSSACIPHVSHGPRVEPGTRWNINASLARSTALQDEQLSVQPSVFFGGAHGWVTEGGAAASIGLQVPVLLLPFVLFDEEPLARFVALLTADAYVQPRQATEGGIDFGIGALASSGFAMPYIQVGRAGDGGIFTTQGVGFTYGTFNRVTYWVPSVSLRSTRADGTRKVDYYLGGLVGMRDGYGPGMTRPRQTEWLVTLGVVTEMRRRR
ncbi:hypothetical protein BH23GEM9_BH23GEM9_00490 [soil metagenome]